MDKVTIKNAIKRLMIEELRDGDSDLMCCDDFLVDLPDEVDEKESDKIADIFFEEWDKYVDKIEEFLKTID